MTPERRAILIKAFETCASYWAELANRAVTTDEEGFARVRYQVLSLDARANANRLRMEVDPKKI